MVRSLLVSGLAILLSLPAVAKPPKHKRKAYVTYKVKEGDSLSKIARRHRLKVADLKKLNGLKRTMIRPGQVLKIRERKRRITRRRKSQESRRAARKRTRRVKRLGPWITHKVRRGDYLWRIADKYDVTIASIQRINRMGKSKMIHPGEFLKIKRKGSQVLRGGVTLPPGSKDKGYVRMRPRRSWGTPGTVRLIQEVYRDFQRMHPKSTPGMIADLSKEGGGHLRPHKSHQRGVDVDVSYYRKDNRRMRGLEVVTPETIDIAKTWDLIRLYLNTGHVTIIFMDYELQGTLHAYLKGLGYGDKLLAKVLQYPRRHKRKGLIRHSPGHHHHLHVRFDCKKASDACARPRLAVIPPPPSVEEPEPIVIAWEPRPEPTRERATRIARLTITETLPPRPVVEAAPVEAPPLTRDELAEFRRQVLAIEVAPVETAPAAQPRVPERALRMTRLGATQ